MSSERRYERDYEYITNLIGDLRRRVNVLEDQRKQDRSLIDKLQHRLNVVDKSLFRVSENDETLKSVMMQFAADTKLNRQCIDSATYHCFNRMYGLDTDNNPHFKLHKMSDEDFLICSINWCRLRRENLEFVKHWYEVLRHQQQN